MSDVRAPVFNDLGHYIDTLELCAGQNILDTHIMISKDGHYSACVYYDMKNGWHLLECTSYGEVWFDLLVTKDEGYALNVARNWVHDRVYTAKV